MKKFSVNFVEIEFFFLILKKFLEPNIFFKYQPTLRQIFEHHWRRNFSNILLFLIVIYYFTLFLQTLTPLKLSYPFPHTRMFRET